MPELTKADAIQVVLTLLGDAKDCLCEAVGDQVLKVYVGEKLSDGEFEQICEPLDVEVGVILDTLVEAVRAWKV